MSYSIACSATISELVSHMESGGASVPLFFAMTNYGGHRWPVDIVQTVSELETYSTLLMSRELLGCQTSDNVPVLSPVACPLPVIASMILPDNTEINFRATRQLTNGIQKWLPHWRWGMGRRGRRGTFTLQILLIWCGCSGKCGRCLDSRNGKTKMWWMSWLENYHTVEKLFFLLCIK